MCRLSDCYCREVAFRNRAKWVDYYKVLPGQGRYHDPILIEKGNWRDVANKEGEGAIGKVHKGHSTDVITNEAISYLENVDKNKPFFLMCHFKAPIDLGNLPNALRGCWKE